MNYPLCQHHLGQQNAVPCRSTHGIVRNDIECDNFPGYLNVANIHPHRILKEIVFWFIGMLEGIIHVRNKEDGGFRARWEVYLLNRSFEIGPC